jgi:chromosome segregation ATPase
MKKQKAQVGKVEAQLRQWGARIDELITKAEKAGEEAKIDYRKHIDELKAKHESAQARLEELKSAGSEKWEIIKTGVEGACKELESAFKKLTESTRKK